MLRCLCGGGSTKRRARQRGGIDELPSGALRVRVYAGMDPISRRRIYLSEVVSTGPRAGDRAERVRTRLLSQVDERRSPRTRATVGQLLDRWLQVLDVDPLTRRGYESKIGKHVRPLLGSLSLTRLDVEALDSFMPSCAAAAITAIAAPTFSTARHNSVSHHVSCIIQFFHRFV
jgi:hypothetical protein